MTREQIEKAANEAVQEHFQCNGKYPCEERDYCEFCNGHNSAFDCREDCGADNFNEGFLAGAQWRINSVWHCANEIPKGGKNYMIVYSFGNSYDLIDIRCDYDRFCKEDWVDYASSKGIKRWAYISDLLPDSGREAGAL